MEKQIHHKVLAGQLVVPGSQRHCDPLIDWKLESLLCDRV